MAVSATACAHNSCGMRPRGVRRRCRHWAKWWVKCVRASSARLKGAWRLLQPLLAGDLRRETRTELATIKRLVEGAAQSTEQPMPSPS